MSTDRAAFTTGLRRMADLIDANPDTPLPYHGNRDNITIFTKRDADQVAQVAQALPYIAQMDDPVMDPNAYSNGPEIQVRGRMAGLAVHVRLRPGDDWPRKVARVHTASDGSVHEIYELVTPAALTEAVEARRSAGPLPVLAYPTYCGECGHDIRPVPMTEVQRVLDRHAAEAGDGRG